MTKELENKLKISENTRIHCPTLELAKQVLNIFNDLGLKWNTDRSYIKHHNWDRYKDKTVYYPIEGVFSYLQFAQDENYKIIHAKEFIALHTKEKEFDLESYIPKGDLKGFPKEIIARMLECQVEQGNKIDVSVFERDNCNSIVKGGFYWPDTKEGSDFWSEVIRKKDFALFFEEYYHKKQETKVCSKCHKEMVEFNLENYIPRGQLQGFPKEIIARMLECQEEQGNKRNVTVFENKRYAGIDRKGFYWSDTKEKLDFWNEVISKRNFSLFFEKYPKQDNQDNSQEFKIGDKVYDIMYRSSGIITKIKIGKAEYPLTVELENGETNIYTIDGRINDCYKTPQLLHYRDNYDYTTIDFSNLLKRQEPKRWRAELKEKYYYLSMYFDVCSLSEDYSNIDTKLYNLGNYFRTKEEAQNAADKLKECFK